MFGLIRLRCQGNQKFFKRELNAFNTLLSDVSFLELISDAIKTCLIFGCSCSSRAVSYFCHNSLRTNCLESELFVSVWSSWSNQPVTDIYSALPQSGDGINIPTNEWALYSCQRMLGFEMICVVVMLNRIWESSQFTHTYKFFKGKHHYLDWKNGLIFFLAAS